MKNIARNETSIKNIAHDAKKRLTLRGYSTYPRELEPPSTLTPMQKSLYLKLRDMISKGEEVVNPIGQLADRKLLESLPYIERQRYIFSLCSDYLTVREILSARLAASNNSLEEPCQVGVCP